MTHWEGLGEADRDDTSSIQEESAVDAEEREVEVRGDERTVRLSST